MPQNGKSPEDFCSSTIFCLLMCAPFPEGDRVQVLYQKTKLRSLPYSSEPLPPQDDTERKKTVKTESRKIPGLTYETLCKRWDGLHKIVYLAFTNRHLRLNAGYLESWQKRLGWTHLNTHTVIWKGRTELNLKMHESTLGDKRSSCTCAGAAPDYIKFLIQPRLCILANQETNSCNLRLWF